MITGQNPMVTFDQSTNRYVRVLDGLGQAVIATDAAGKILSWSSAAEKLYGWKAKEVIGRDVLEVTPTALSRSRGAEIMQTLAQGQVWSGEFRVQKRRGKPFMASVTDVPLLGAAGGVAGVIGVSAPSRSPTRLAPLLKKIAAAAGRVWPRQITFDVALPAAASVTASEPHIVQLLALLILLYSDALDRGAEIEVAAGSAEKSPFAEFGLAADAPALYLRIDRRDERPSYSVLRSLPFTTEPTKYTSALVRMVGGMLISGTAPGRLSALHLFLPLTSSRRS
jgi:PAS domain S-box-containing protein